MTSIAPKSGTFKVVIASSKDPFVSSGTGWKEKNSLKETVELSGENEMLTLR